MDKYKSQIISIIQSGLTFSPIEIILFGSRAEGRSNSTSDYDIALKAAGQIPVQIISAIKEKLEESNIPYKIDIVDYRSISLALQATIDKGGIKW